MKKCNMAAEFQAPGRDKEIEGQVTDGDLREVFALAKIIGKALYPRFKGYRKVDIQAYRQLSVDVRQECIDLHYRHAYDSAGRCEASFSLHFPMDPFGGCMLHHINGWDNCSAKLDNKTIELILQELLSENKGRYFYTID